MNLLRFLNPRLWLALGLLALLSTGAWRLHHNGVVSGRAEVQAQWDAQRADLARQSAALQANTEQQTAALIVQANTEGKAKDEKIRVLRAAVSAVVNSLSNRAERPASADLPAAAAPSAASGCTGAQLYRADGEFLAGEAARADQLRLDLGQCQAQYRSARDALK